MEDGSQITASEIVDYKPGFLGSLLGYSVTKVSSDGTIKTYAVSQHRVTYGNGKVVKDLRPILSMLASAEESLRSNPPRQS